jgi:RNA polymerase sigma-70 factor (ECF subfamily)
VQDEESLVRRAQQQDEEAFAQLYEVHFDRIYRYVVLRIGNAMEAEDLTQQVFLKALKSISAFKWKGAPFSSWLFRIAHNQIVDYLRKRKKHMADPIEDTAATSNSNPQAEVERKLDIERLLSATQHLTESQREVISLRFTSEMSIAEVARVIGKSEGAVKALQHSAVVALRKILSVAE